MTFDAIQKALAAMYFTYTEEIIVRHSNAQRILCTAKRTGDGVEFRSFYYRGNESANEARLSVLCEAQAHVIRCLMQSCVGV